jgi:hypothetical protein
MKRDDKIAWLIIVLMFLFIMTLMYIGDFLGCYYMRTFSTSCDWFIDIQNKF